jgi:hypothetical protein
MLAIYISPTNLNPKVVTFEVIAALAAGSAILTIAYLFNHNRSSDCVINPYRKYYSGLVIGLCI